MKELILVTGSGGLVGSRFVELFPKKELLYTPSEKEMDITNSDVVKEIFTKYPITTVVHFAAYTDVGKAEDERGNEEGLCWRVNVEGTRNLVGSINTEKTHFIQISTDMVFSGGKHDPGPYGEDHEIEVDEDKLSWYGFTKMQAEKLVFEKLKGKATILRIIYPVRTEFEAKLDYLRKPLKLYDEGRLYPLFTDQQISITFIDEVAKALDKIIAERIFGVFHASCSDTTSPYELISYMLEKTRDAKDAVQEVTLNKFLKKTKRSSYRYPRFHGLRVEKTQKALRMKFSSWRNIVDNLVQQGLGD